MHFVHNDGAHPCQVGVALDAAEQDARRHEQKPGVWTGPYQGLRTTNNEPQRPPALLSIPLTLHQAQARRNLMIEEVMRNFAQKFDHFDQKF